MRAPKGFGKRYFTLSAIQAYSGGVTLQRCESRLLAHHRQVSDECDDETSPEEDDPLLCETTLQELPGGRRRPCHCNRHFHRRACRHLRSHPRPKRFVRSYRLTFSVLAPPRRIFIPHPTNNDPKDENAQYLQTRFAFVGSLRRTYRAGHHP